MHSSDTMLVSWAKNLYAFNEDVCECAFVLNILGARKLNFRICFEDIRIQKRHTFSIPKCTCSCFLLVAFCKCRFCAKPNIDYFFAAHTLLCHCRKGDKKEVICKRQQNYSQIYSLLFSLLFLVHHFPNTQPLHHSH